MPGGPGYPSPVLRRWSDALAEAALFPQALLVHPQDDDGLFRRAELAVLAGDHAAALGLLKEYDDGGEPEPGTALLTAVARTWAGEPGGWQQAQAAAAALPGPRWTSWLLALAGAVVPDLEVAGPAASRAHAGGCRDPRLPVISVAGSVAAGDQLSWQQCAAAVQVLEGCRVAELPGEDAIGSALSLLGRAGHPDRAADLAAYAVIDSELSREAQEAWRVAAKQRQIVLPRRIRLTGRGDSRGQRRLRRALSQDLTCRCTGSAGWAGPDREPYVRRHLTEVDAAPVPGLEARLVSCRATGLRFLDLAREQLTLPVDAG